MHAFFSMEWEGNELGNYLMVNGHPRPWVLAMLDVGALFLFKKNIRSFLKDLNIIFRSTFSGSSFLRRVSFLCKTVRPKRIKMMVLEISFWLVL